MIDEMTRDLPEAHARRAGAPQVLEGVRVLDFSHFIAGPFATMMLADMGADVIKIEAPGRGDDFRYYPPAHPAAPTQGAPFVWSNRNKRSMALDLKTPQALALARELVEQADVIVENFSTGVMARFGLDYESCRQINPRVIYCSMSAYGRDGEFADRLGFDPVVQAESGFVSMNGYADREGVRALSPVMDIGTAMLASNALLGALLARERTGQGQAIEVALFDSALLMTGYATMQYLFTGKDPQRHGNTSPDTCPSGVFRASDKSFYINCGNDKIFQRLATQVLELPQLAQDPQLARAAGRAAQREELFGVLREAFGAKPWSHWRQRMRAAGIPHGELRTVGEALRSEETRARGMVNRLRHPTLGWLPNIPLPIHFSGTPLRESTPAPLVGEHTLEVLRELGCSDERIAALRASGALGGAAAGA
jgi:crotonobetainyl-CoA:carnitine CoA-transferase CaiB-like acyl-CoA transferase